MNKRMTLKWFLIYTIAFLILLPAVYSILMGVISAVDVIIEGRVPFFISLVIWFAAMYLCAYGASQRVLNSRMPEMNRLRIFLFLAVSCVISVIISCFSLELGFYCVVILPALYLGTLILAYRQRYRISLKFSFKVGFCVALYFLAAVFINIMLGISEDFRQQVFYLFYAPAILVLNFMLADAWICNADIKKR